MNMLAKISLNTVGEITKNPYVGDFEVRKVLSIRQKLAIQQDIDRLSNYSKTISEDGLLYATVFAELAQRIANAPDWYKNSNGGLDISDFNVVMELFLNARKISADYEDEMAKAAESAKSK